MPGLVCLPVQRATYVTFEVFNDEFLLTALRAWTTRRSTLRMRTIMKLVGDDGKRFERLKVCPEGMGGVGGPLTCRFWWLRSAKPCKIHQPEKLQTESQHFLSTSTLLAKGSMQRRARRASVHPYTPPTFECAFSGHPPETPFLLSWHLARYRYPG